MARVAGGRGALLGGGRTQQLKEKGGGGGGGGRSPGAEVVSTRMCVCWDSDQTRLAGHGGFELRRS